MSLLLSFRTYLATSVVPALRISRPRVIVHRLVLAFPLLPFPHHFQVPVKHLPLVLVRPVIFPSPLNLFHALCLLKKLLLLLQNLLLQSRYFLYLLIQTKNLQLLVVIRLAQWHQHLLVTLLLLQNHVDFTHLINVQFSSLTVYLFYLLNHHLLFIVPQSFCLQFFPLRLELIITAWKHPRKLSVNLDSQRIPFVSSLLHWSKFLQLDRWPLFWYFSLLQLS